jgi:ABC-type phosphate transport system auxiliary subunit
MVRVSSWRGYVQLTHPISLSLCSSQLRNTLQSRLDQVRLEKSRLQEQLALQSETCASMEHELCRLQKERQSSLEEEDEMEEEN